MRVLECVRACVRACCAQPEEATTVAAVLVLVGVMAAAAAVSAVVVAVVTGKLLAVYSIPGGVCTSYQWWYCCVGSGCTKKMYHA